MSVVHYNSGVFYAWIDGVLTTITVGGGVGPFTAGSIPFSDGIILVEDNANLFWDNIAKYLRTQKIIGGVNTNSTLTFQTTTGVGVTGNDFIFLNGDNGNQVPFKIVFRPVDNLSVFKINNPIYSTDNIALVVKGIGAGGAWFESQSPTESIHNFFKPTTGDLYRIGAGIISVNDFGIKNNVSGITSFQIIGGVSAGQVILRSAAGVQLCFQGLDATCPALKRAGTTLEVKLADDSTYTDLLANAVSLIGGQLKFPATQNASSDVNTLDDYEEGSWSPVIGGLTSESGQTYSSQVGRYVKIGSIVIVYGRVRLSTKGTIVGSVVIKGLPFASDSTTNAYAGFYITGWQSMAVNFVAMSTVIVPGNSYADVFGLTAAGTDSAVSVVESQLGATAGFFFIGLYKAVN